MTEASGFRPTDRDIAKGVGRIIPRKRPPAIAGADAAVAKTTKAASPLRSSTGGDYGFKPAASDKGERKGASSKKPDVDVAAAKTKRAVKAANPFGSPRPMKNSEELLWVPPPKSSKSKSPKGR